MNIRWKISLENPKMLQIYHEDLLWKEVPKAGFLRQIASLLPVGSFGEFSQKFDELEKMLAKGYVLRLLSARGYLSRELEDRLRKKGYSKKASNYALDECIRMKYVDDDAHLPLLIQSFIRKGYGPRMVRAKLLQKRIEFANIDALLTKEYPLEKQRDVIEELRKKKSKLVKETLWRYLLRRGFTQEIIYDALSS